MSVTAPNAAGTVGEPANYVQVRSGSKTGNGPSYLMTLSADSRNDSGIESPGAFAVLRLTARLNLTGPWIGSSPGLAPRRILSMYSAARPLIGLAASP